MEVNGKNNNKGLIILIIILSLMIVGLGGWIVYDKLICNKEKPIQETNNKDTDNQEKDVNNDTITLKDYPEKSDIESIGFVSDLLKESDFKKNFKNLKREKDGIKFVYNCTEYKEECEWVKVTINDVITIESGYDEDYIMLEKLYVVNGYYIIKDSNYEANAGESQYTIYDKKGKQVYFGLNHIGLDDVTPVEIPEVVFNKNKMYIVETVCGLGLDEEGEKKVCKHDIEFEYNIIDLSKEKIDITKVTEFYVDDPWGDDEE